VSGCARLPDADFHYANLRGADLRDCILAGASFADSDLVEADLSRADLNGVVLDRADLRQANLAGIKNWQGIKSLDHANVLGARNAPAGFMQWAAKKGAVESNAQ
jgi:uncharacterized protein YjbI with pentapeptide repeats